MEFSTDQRLSIAKEVKSLIDENLQNAVVLERAYSLAKVVLGIFSNDGDKDSIGFSLQEYAYERLETSRGRGNTTAWIDVNNEKLNKALGLES